VNKSFLQPGDSFEMLDANATDKDGALFQFPADVASCATGATAPTQRTFTYDVFGRALGKPGGSATMTTCSTNKDFMRMKGKSTFQNVTDQLFTITATVTDASLATCLGTVAGTSVTVNLFNPCLQNFFWNYDNNGLKLLQLRFYAES